MINLVFYICWLPNLICGITLWTMWHALPERFLISIWYIMAIINPLQAFFNTLVYRKWQPNSSTAMSTTYLHQSMLQRAFRSATNPLDERAPLLQPPKNRKPTAPPFHQL